MKFQYLVSLLALSASSLAVELVSGSFGQQPFAINSPASKAVVFNQTSEKVDISFELQGKRQPDTFIKLANKYGQETSFKPIVKITDSGNFKNSFSLTYNKLPKVFTKDDRLTVSLISGSSDEDKSQAIKQDIGSIKLTNTLVEQSKYIKPSRFGPKEEIHHIFQQAPKTVNPMIALVFASLAMALCVMLLGYWAMEGLLNFKDFPGLDLNHLAFISALIGYEVVFFQYYLGSSIFETIFKVAILLGPTVWFGSRVLNYLGSLRLAGKR